MLSYSSSSSLTTKLLHNVVHVISNHIFYKYVFSLTNFKSPSCDTNVVNYELVNFSEMTMSLKKHLSSINAT